ncbi:MAG: 1-acyl-sn-glycerol-3-phosphate acyltransferase [Alphaproteobacteria bacterium]|jgi:1-acyl-sn-glycerol-3-phosphate acyltransferase
MMLVLRSIVFNLYFYCVSFGFLLIILPRLLWNINYAHNVCYKWGCIVAWGLKHICNIHIAVRGAEYIPKSATLFACKHQSAMETTLLFMFVHRPSIILKKELSYIPFTKYLIKGAGHITVDRKMGAQARVHIVDEAKNRIDNNQSVLIFPEGTRSLVNSAPRYKRGIFSIYTKVNTPCTPIALNSGLFWPKNSFLRHPGTVIFEFLAPIEAGLNENEFMTTLTTRIEGTVARLVQEGVAEQSALKRKTHPRYNKPS